MKCLRYLAVASLALAAASARAQITETPTYSNALVISVDPLRRIIVLRTAPGRRETLVFDDLLAGSGAAKAGDRVIVTVRGGPGRRRISAIKVITPSAPAAEVTRPSPETPDEAGMESVRAEARARYSDQVATLSQRAQSVDGIWNTFVKSCAVKPVSNEGGGRDWFGLWDGRVFADYSGGECRDLFNQIVSAGEVIKKSMAEVEIGIEKRLIPGEIRDIRRSHSMNWDGFLLPPPQRREP